MPESVVQDMSPRNTSGATGRAGRAVPLAPAQQAALLPERLRRIPAANLLLAFEITGAIADDAVERAAAAVLTEHEILRTVFPDDRRVPYQRTADLPGPVVRVAALEPAALDAALAEDAAHAFDLVRDIPVRISLHRTADRAVLTLVAHPVAADDVTLDLLAEALLAELGAASPAGTAAPGTTTAADGSRAVPFRSLVPQLVKGMAVDPATDTDAAYWLSRLADLPDRATVAEPGAEPTRTSFRLAPEALADLTAGRDPVAAFAALLAHALADAGLGADPAVGVLDPARDDTTAATLGTLANYLVLRGLTGADAPRQAVRTADELLTEARAHAATRIEFLTHRLRGAAAVSGGALFQAALVLREGEPIRYRGASWEATEIARHTARPHGVDLLVSVRLDGDGALVVLDAPAAPAGLPAFTAHLERRALAWTDGRDEAGDTALFRAPVTGPDALGPGLGGPPETDAERTVAAAIRTVLDLDEDDEVGRDDTFFSLGGDSIAALRLVTVLAEDGYALDVQTVFGFPAVRELAEQLRAAAPEPASRPRAAAPLSASGLDPAVLAALGAKFGTE